MSAADHPRPARMITALAAIVFGIVTVFAGGRVLLGADPGYVVLRPLLGYNTLMGVAYVIAGVLIWRSIRLGTWAAALIFGLNLIVLLGILMVYRSGGVVAVDSLRAMTFRTVVWLVLFLAAWRLGAPGGKAPTGS